MMRKIDRVDLPRFSTPIAWFDSSVDRSIFHRCIFCRAVCIKVWSDTSYCLSNIYYYFSI